MHPMSRTPYKHCHKWLLGYKDIPGFEEMPRLAYKQPVDISKPDHIRRYNDQMKQLLGICHESLILNRKES